MTRQEQLQDVGVHARRVRKGGGSSTVWLSRTDESGEEREPSVCTAARLQNWDPGAGRARGRLRRTLGSRLPGQCSGRCEQEGCLGIRSHFAGLNRVLGEHMDSVHESWQERDHDW